MRPRELSRTVTAFAARTPTLPPATHTNSYALGSREVLLVEPATPYEDEQRAWVSWARALASQGRTPVAIVLTHHHQDHAGGAAELARALKLPVLAHAETASRVDVRVDRLLSDHEVLPLSDGEERWEVLHTPGHAPGHICLYDAHDGVLVVGDMVASVGTILIATQDGGDMIAYLEQLRRLESLHARLALPAHGEPIDDPSQLFARYVAHRAMREAKVLASLHDRRDATIAELVPAAYDDTPAHVWPIAALSLEAHLAKLVREGRVREEGGRYSVKV